MCCERDIYLLFWACCELKQPRQIVKSLCILEYLTCEINFRQKRPNHAIYPAGKPEQQNKVYHKWICYSITSSVIASSLNVKSGIGYSPKKETTGVYHKQNKPKFPAYHGSLANKVLKFKPADGWWYFKTHLQLDCGEYAVSLAEPLLGVAENVVPAAATPNCNAALSEIAAPNNNTWFTGRVWPCQTVRSFFSRAVAPRQI